MSWIWSNLVSFFRSILMSSDSHCSTLCPRFNERSDVEATTRLASEAMPTHNPYAPFTPFVPLANHRPQQLVKPQ